MIFLQNGEISIFLLDNRPLLQYTGITVVEVQQSEAGKQSLMPLALGSTASLRDPTAALRKPNFYGSFSDASDLFAAFRFSQSQGLRCHVCRSPWLFCENCCGKRKMMLL